MLLEWPLDMLFIDSDVCRIPSFFGANRHTSCNYIRLILSSFEIQLKAEGITSLKFWTYIATMSTFPSMLVVTWDIVVLTFLHAVLFSANFELAFAVLARWIESTILPGVVDGSWRYHLLGLVVVRTRPASTSRTSWWLDSWDGRMPATVARPSGFSWAPDTCCLYGSTRGAQSRGGASVCWR